MNTRRVPTCFESMQSLGFVFRVADRLGVRKSPISPLLLRHRGPSSHLLDGAHILVGVQPGILPHVPRLWLEHGDQCIAHPGVGRMCCD